MLGKATRITRGYGTARPRTTSTGGDPTGIVDNIAWSSWGGARAIGSGMGYYDPPGKPVSRSVREKATVVAFHLTTCDGTYMYENVEFYFPESGGKFDPTTYLDACSWTWQGESR